MPAAKRIWNWRLCRDHTTVVISHEQLTARSPEASRHGTRGTRVEEDQWCWVRRILRGLRADLPHLRVQLTKSHDVADASRLRRAEVHARADLARRREATAGVTPPEGVTHMGRYVILDQPVQRGLASRYCGGAKERPR